MINNSYFNNNLINYRANYQIFLIIVHICHSFRILTKIKSRKQPIIHFYLIKQFKLKTKRKDGI